MCYTYPFFLFPFFPADGLDAFYKLIPGNQHIMITSKTLDPDICTNSQDTEFIAFAGMWFF